MTTDTAGERPANSYDPTYFAPLFAVEDQHFWFRSRNRVIAELTRQVVGALGRAPRVLEVGCGTGNVLRALEHTWGPRAVIGMDLFLESLRFARRRTTCGLVQGDIQSLPFDEPFDIIGLFDVLEHIPDDEGTLRHLSGGLAGDGRLVLTVPAHPSLWSYFDVAAHHQRRYTLATLRQVLERAGFEVEYISQYMAAIFPLVWAGRRLSALGGAKDPAQVRSLATREFRITPVINEILTWVLTHETRLMARRRTLPIGTSLVAIACKRSAGTTPL
jgi:SAM-dependent methyltransferase